MFYVKKIKTTKIRARVGYLTKTLLLTKHLWGACTCLCTLGGSGALLLHHHRLLTLQDGTGPPQGSLRERGGGGTESCISVNTDVFRTPFSRNGPFDRVKGSPRSPRIQYIDD